MYNLFYSYFLYARGDEPELAALKEQIETFSLRTWR